MDLRIGMHGGSTTLEPGDMLMYSKVERRIQILRGKTMLYFAGGTFDTFLIPQTDDGFGLASIISYVTGLPFETREHRGVRAYLFGKPHEARSTADSSSVRRLERPGVLIEHER